MLFRVFRRAFQTSSVSRADALRDLYLNELKKYVPVQGNNATDLKDTFALPAASAKPEVEKATVSAIADTEATKEEEWPALYDAINDPANYNDEFEWEKDDGSWYPKRLYPRDYDHHH